jgi:hypothetical protein
LILENEGAKVQKAALEFGVGKMILGRIMQTPKDAFRTNTNNFRKRINLLYCPQQP